MPAAYIAASRRCRRAVARGGGGESMILVLAALVGCAKRSVPTSTCGLFSKLTGKRPHVATPVRRQNSAFNIAMKRTEWPIADLRNVAVLHGIEVNVVHMTFEIAIITDRVLPITTLPKPSFTFGDLARRA